MKLTRKAVTALLTAIVLVLYPALALASSVPRKHSSAYGKEGLVQDWNLFGPTDLVSFSGLKMRVQVRCPGQDVEGVTGNPTLVTPVIDPAKVGGCDSGIYFFLFQIPSGPKNLEITFSHLVNFTFNDDPTLDGAATVGVMRCDLPTDPDVQPNNANTAALCTTVMTSTGETVDLPNITFKHKGNTEVTFLIPEIPEFPDPDKTCDKSVHVCHEGRGLTLVLQMGPGQPNQPVVPFGFPTVTVKTDSDLD